MPVKGFTGSCSFAGTIVSCHCNLNILEQDWICSLERFKRSSFYILLVFHLRIYCAWFTHNPLQDTDPIFIEILWMHGQFKAKADCDAFLMDMVCSCFHQKKFSLVTMDPIDKFGYDIRMDDTRRHCVMAIVIAGNVLQLIWENMDSFYQYIRWLAAGCRLAKLHSINIMALPKADIISPYYSHLLVVLYFF
jgi:hypothetical protein